MADMAHLIEPVIPALRRYARTFVRGAARRLPGFRLLKIQFSGVDGLRPYI
jgi:hypothetical protein